MTLEQQINAWAAGGTVLAFCVAAAGFIYSLIDRRNERLTNQAILALERAYEGFTGRGTLTEPPHDRLVWLTTARHIERFHRLKSLLRCPGTHQIILEEHEEYWRQRFYDFVHPLALHIGFFDARPNPSTGESAQIEPASAVSVIGFGEWKKGRDDPIDQINIPQRVAESDNKMFEHRALLMYLEARGKLPPTAQINRDT